MDRCPVKQGDEQSSPCFYVFAAENSKKTLPVSYREKSGFCCAANKISHYEIEYRYLEN
jgi:hypothetical protein